MWRQSLLQSALVAAIASFIGLSFAQHHELPNGGQIKAVLVAASNEWKNYRHQSDICHAYQVLRGNGIPEENIIVFMYDDIAYNHENPHKGVIINRPGGPNVYKNIKMDYKGENITKKVLFDVLRGNKAGVKGIGTGRVLESGPNDIVFINYVDHGGVGYFLLMGEIITSKEFLSILQTMKDTSKFQKMFLYINACFSGSVAKLIPKNMGIFAMTSANARESSHSCFNWALPDKKRISIACEFGIFWMRDAETSALKKETAQEEFLKVRSEVKKSNVSEYGDLELGKTKVSEYLGFREEPMPLYPLHCKDPVPECEGYRVYLEGRIAGAVDIEEKRKYMKELQDLLQARKEMVQFFTELISEVLYKENKMEFYHDVISKEPYSSTSNLDCYFNAVELINDNCFKVTNPDLCSGPQLITLQNLCDVLEVDEETQLTESILSICHAS